MPKRTLQGVVVSDKQAKTVVVRVDRRFTHPIYKKTIRRSKNYHAHDENNEFKPGDTVWIEESKPISKLKRWTVVQGEKRKPPEPSRHKATDQSGRIFRKPQGADRVMLQSARAQQKEDEVHQ